MPPLIFCTIFLFLAHCDVTEAFEENQIKNTIFKGSKKPEETEVNEIVQLTLESLVLTDKNIPECNNVNQKDTGGNCSISTEENVELDPNLGTLSIQKSQNNVDETEINAEDVIAKNSELIAKINQELLNVDAFKNVNSSNNQETESTIPPEKVLFSQDTNGIKNQFSVLMTPPTGKKHAYKSRGYYLNF